MAELDNVTAEEFEKMLDEFVGSEFKPYNLQELSAYADFGLKVIHEDTSINLYQLYANEDVREKAWEMVALTTCYLAELPPEEKRVRDFEKVLEKHFQNMVRKVARKANPVEVSSLLRMARNEASEPLTRGQLERISIGSSLLLVALKELEDENMEP